MGSMVPLIALRISFGTAFQNYFYGLNHNPTSNERIMSALVGGCVPSLLGSPMEFMRAHQLKTKVSLPATAKMFSKQHGVFVLFKGMLGTATRDGLYTCGFFAIAPILKEKIEPYCNKPWMSTVISGPAAGTIAAFTSQPFDTIKMYQQISLEKKKITIREAAREIIKKDGLTGFFKGATPRILRIISGVTVISTANEKITNYFENNNRINTFRKP